MGMGEKRGLLLLAVESSHRTDSLWQILYEGTGFILDKNLHAFDDSNCSWLITRLKAASETPALRRGSLDRPFDAAFYQMQSGGNAPGA
jgi:hypothetical protein